jgi:hypothetical protein
MLLGSRIGRVGSHVSALNGIQRLEGDAKGMRSKVAAAIAMFVAVAATTASAGVIITQNVVTTSQTGPKGKQTVMIQGNKRKVVTSDRIYITDLDVGKTSVLIPKTKGYGELAFPPTGVMAVLYMKEGTSVEFKKTNSTHKVAGYDCQDYAGTMSLAHQKVDSTECVASAAPGAQEYVAFRKAVAAKLKGTPIEPKGEVPDGIPVSSTVTASFVPFPIPKNFPPELTAKVNESNAKIKPEVTKTTVTKIEAKEIPAGEFEVPAEYKPSGPKIPFKQGVPGGPNPPIPAPEQPIPPGAMPPSPAAH